VFFWEAGSDLIFVCVQAGVTQWPKSGQVFADSVQRTRPCDQLVHGWDGFGLCFYKFYRRFVSKFCSSVTYTAGEKLKVANQIFHSK